MQTAPATKDTRFFAFLLAIAALDLWVLPLRSSLWTDETATYWIVKDGLANTVTRSFEWAGQSPLYYLTTWLSLAAGGRHEVALRLPSILSTAVAVWLLYRLAARFFDAPTARTAAVIFACSQPVAYAASDARPYALGLCLLLGSSVMLVRWLDTGRWVHAAAYALLAALTVYAHYLLATGLVVLGLYAMHRCRHQARVKLPELFAAWVAAGILLAPLYSQLRHFFHSRAEHSFAPTPGFTDLLGSLVPPALAGSLVLGLMLAWRVRTLAADSPAGGRSELATAAAWFVAPPLICWLVAVATESKIFVPRYYIAAMPGMALLYGWGVRAHTSDAGRRIALTVLVIASTLSFGSPHHGSENWLKAMGTVRSTAGGTNLPVLVASGFVEAADPRRLDDPKLRQVLFAPLEMYPAAGRVIRLPYRLDERSARYVENVIATELEREDRFLFVGEWQGLSFEPWLRGRLAARGFTSVSLGDFGSVGVFLFARSG